MKSVLDFLTAAVETIFPSHDRVGADDIEVVRERVKWISNKSPVPRTKLVVA